MDQKPNMGSAEPVGLEPEKLELLYSRLGKREAEDLICRATEKIAQHIRLLCEDSDDLDTGRLVRSARLIAELSEHVGLSDLRRVANDVTICLLRADDVAISATSARLGRLGERSLIAIWELQDQSG